MTNTSHPTVVSLFDRTGELVKPWLDHGYHAVTVDVQPSELIHPNHRHIIHDLRTLPPDLPTNPTFVAAFPPCTDLAISGAKHFKNKSPRALADAFALIATAYEFATAQKAPYFIENPISTISTYWRKPDYYFHPHDYHKYEKTNPYTKKTCLWVGNGFVLPTKSPHSDPDSNRILYSKQRDRTPTGFAHAVFLANAPTLFITPTPTP